MYRVVLVDDEVFIREGLKVLIDWKGCGYEICGEASDGEDALKIIEKEQPDVVITDIRMPGMDGLELIRCVTSNQFISPKFIVISGHSEFSYAQQAIKYGVCDFILKPISKKEFERALERIFRLLDAQKEQAKVMEEQLSKILFHKLIKGENDCGTVYEQVQRFGVPASSLFCYVMVEVNRDNDVECLDNIYTRHKIEDLFKKKIKQPLHFPIYEHELDRYGLLLMTGQETEMFENISILYEQLKQLGLSTTVYASDFILGFNQLRKAVEQVYYMMSYKYVIDEGPILYERIEGIDIYYGDIDGKLCEKLIEYIEESRISDVLCVVNHIFDEFRMKLFAVEAVKSSITYLVREVANIVKQFGGDAEQLKTFSNVMKCRNYNVSLNELEQRFSHFVVECANLVSQLREQMITCEIHKVKKYIEENYHKNISLKHIAQRFYMNPVYLGQLFRKTYGVYFKKFLLQLRIQQAKKLLRTTDLRIYEIAEQVGFGSVDYFVTQFEKMEGFTPTEYRKQTIRT